MATPNPLVRLNKVEWRARRKSGIQLKRDGKLCARESKCGVAALERLSEKRNIEDRGERNVINGREFQRQQRPRMALGRWLKTPATIFQESCAAVVAPAPSEDVISEARDDGSKKVGQ